MSSSFVLVVLFLNAVIIQGAAGDSKVCAGRAGTATAQGDARTTFFNLAQFMSSSLLLLKRFREARCVHGSGRVLQVS